MFMKIGGLNQNPTLLWESEIELLLFLEVVELLIQSCALSCLWVSKFDFYKTVTLFHLVSNSSLQLIGCFGFGLTMNYIIQLILIFCIRRSLLMPVMLLSILCSLSFLLDPDEQEKLNVSITILLSFTVFLGVIDMTLPTTSDNSMSVLGK